MSEKKVIRNRHGFTLVEMLVVIAIIAVLVSILVPTTTGATKKAKAATDAANLRTLLSVINIEYLDGNKEFAESKTKAMTCQSKTFEGAGTCAVFSDNGAYFALYYFVGDTAYSVEYFSLAADGRTGTTTTLAALKAEYGEENVIILKDDEE